MRKKATARLLPLLLAAALLTGIFGVPAAASAQPAAASDVTQLTRSEGAVQVINSYGRELTVRGEMRLYNGTRVLTGADGYAWLSLDSVKTVKLDASSAVQLRRSGLRQEALVESGDLFFSASEPPVDLQTLCLRTGVAAMFIRSACGFVENIDQWHTRLTVLDGTVDYAVTDPVTGQQLTGTAEAGQTLLMTVLPPDREGSKCSVERQELLLYEIGGYVLEALAQDMALCGRLYDSLNVDVLPPLGLLGSVDQMLDAIKMRPAQVRSLLQEQGDTEQSRQSLAELQQQLEQIWQLLDGAGLSSLTAKQGLQQVQALQQAARQSAESGELIDAVELLEDSRQAMELAIQNASKVAQGDSLQMARTRLGQDQALASDLQAVIDEQLLAQEEGLSRTPVWEKAEPTATPAPTSSVQGGAGGAGGSVPPPTIPATPVPTPRQMIMGQFTLTELQQAIYSSPGGVVVLPSENPEENVLGIGSGQSLYLPRNRSLTFQSDSADPNSIISIEVAAAGEDGQSIGSLTIEGTLSAPGCPITNRGRLSTAGQVDSGPITTYGSMSVYGSVSSSITQEAGNLGIQSTTVNGELLEPDIAGGIVLHTGILSMSSGRVHHGIVQTRETGQAYSTANISGGVITGGYYYHYVYNADAAADLQAQEPPKQDTEMFNLTISGGIIEYRAEEAPEGIAGALALDCNDFVINAKVNVSGGTLNGGEDAPAVTAAGTWTWDVTIGADARVKSSITDLIRYAEDAGQRVTFKGKTVTADSYLVTEQQEDGTYLLTDVTTFQDVLENAEVGQTVTLDKDRSLTDSVTVPDGVTLDLNGHTLTLGAPLAAAGSLTVTGTGTITGAEHIFTVADGKTWAESLSIGAGVTLRAATEAFAAYADGTAVEAPEGYTVTGPDEEGCYTLTTTPDPEATETPEPTVSPAAVSEVQQDGANGQTAAPDQSTEPAETAGPTEGDATAEPDETAEPSAEPETTEDAESSSEPTPEPTFAPAPTLEPVPVDSENTPEVLA